MQKKTVPAAPTAFTSFFKKEGCVTPPQEEEETRRMVVDADDLEISEYKGVILVEHRYPDPQGVNTTQIGLMHVRCVDDIRVRFDFARNAWIVSQLRVTDNDDDEWVEAAELPAFQFDERTDA